MADSGEWRTVAPRGKSRNRKPPSKPTSAEDAGSAGGSLPTTRADSQPLRDSTRGRRRNFTPSQHGTAPGPEVAGQARNQPPPQAGQRGWTTTRGFGRGRGHSNRGGGHGTRATHNTENQSAEATTASRFNALAAASSHSSSGRWSKHSSQSSVAGRGGALRGHKERYMRGQLSASDGDDSDDDEDDVDIETAFPPVSIMVLCPFTDCTDDAPLPLTQPNQLIEHLLDVHGLTFKNIHHMYFSLQKYLDTWAEKRGQSAGAMGAIDGVAVTDPSEASSSGKPQYTVDPAQCPDDAALRKLLQKEKLDEILATQERERQTDAKQPRKCLFCRHTCDNRAVLFRHMFVEHSFNIGLPDNLVNVSEFLAILEDKLANLKCLYCEKTFTSAAVLRKHMRKKKHFKISSRNRVYDRFYVVNFLEPGKNWESFENEVYESDEDGAGRRDDSWEDWEEAVTEPTMCLFDQVMEDSPIAICEHMKHAHGFDLPAIRQAHHLDFYKTVTLINYVRRQASLGICVGCDANVGGLTQLADHMTANGCFAKLPPGLSHPIWADPQYLFPTYEDDPLLIWVDDDDDADDHVAQVRNANEPHRGLRQPQQSAPISSSVTAPTPDQVADQLQQTQLA
ncbi:hypothetical protein H4R35_004922 [Dimargaris xerosporica]|nr:hypothetical protein H4R35_004922 [Dimargaris xerosporica]